jgi:NDP-sugar pyrophosphorylase family protein
MPAAAPWSPSYYFSGDASLPFDLLSSERSLDDLFDRVQLALEGLVGNRVYVGGDIGSSVHVDGPVYIGPGTVLCAGAAVEGPVYVGARCSIGGGALLRPGTILCDGCTVGHGAEIKASLCMAGSKMQSGVFVGDSIVGLGARIGSGTILTNRRFDQGPVRLGTREMNLATSRVFLGAIVGDYARLGANVTVAPGSLIGPYTWIGSLVNVHGFVERARLVLVKQDTENKGKGETPLHA